MLLELLRAWEHHSDRHVVLSLLPRGQLAGEFEALDVSVLYAGLSPKRLELAKLLKIRRILRDLYPDVINTWLYHANLIGSIAGTLAGRTPIVWGIHHSLNERATLKPSTWRLIRWLARLSAIVPAQIIYCSKSALETHARNGFSRRRMRIIPNGVDPVAFRPDASAHGALVRELNIPGDAPLIGMLARYHPAKDHANFLSAAGMLLNGRPDVHFALAGQGMVTSNELLQSQIQTAKVQHRVHLLGVRHDVARILAAMQIVTLSSYEGEALPMSLCEAMACGVPCVGTRVGDVGALLGDAGVIVEPGRPDKLAVGWRQILDLPERHYRQLAARARERVIEHYNIHQAVEAYRQVYRSCAGSR